MFMTRVECGKGVIDGCPTQPTAETSAQRLGFSATAPEWWLSVRMAGGKPRAGAGPPTIYSKRQLNYFPSFSGMTTSTRREAAQTRWSFDGFLLVDSPLSDSRIGAKPVFDMCRSRGSKSKLEIEACHL